jgi:hypothetical protein
MNILSRILRSDRAATAAEFAIVLPLLIILLFGLIDAGRFLWDYNRAEKATQMGVRYAVVTDPVLKGLDGSYSFAVDGGIPQGNTIPTANFDKAVCDNSSCSCVSTTGSFCGATSYNSAAFANIVQRMHYMYPPITAANVQITYKNVGLGFAGDPDGSDVSPLVTVNLRNLTFHPITCFVFPCSMAMGSFSAALTAEDLSNNGLSPPRAN